MDRKILIPILIGLAAASPSHCSSIVYNRVQAAGTVAHTITIDLADPDVRVSVALAQGGAGRSESFKSIIRRSRPAAAITGTFFDTRTLIPTGDIALFGHVVHSGCIGSALCIDGSHKASIVPLHAGRLCHWTGYETVLCAGPTLVAGGKVALALKHEGFRRSLMAPARRTAVGITGSGKLLLIAVNRQASLYSVAKLNDQDERYARSVSGRRFVHRVLLQGPVLRSAWPHAHQLPGSLLHVPGLPQGEDRSRAGQAPGKRPLSQNT